MEGAEDTSESPVRLDSLVGRRVLVTGSSGFLGGHLSRALGGAGANPVGFDRRPGPTTDVVGSLSDEVLLAKACDGADVVIHAAGLAHSRPRTAQERERFFLVNTEGTRAVVERTEGPVVLVSSSAVYGFGGPFAEDDPIEGESAYARSKCLAEELVLSSGRGLVARPSMFFGRGAPGNLAKLAKLVRLGWFPSVRRGRARKSIAHVSTIVDGLLLMAASAAGGGRPRVYNLSDDSPVSMAQIGEALGEGLGARVRHVPIPEWPLQLMARLSRGPGRGAVRAYIEDACLDTTRARGELGHRSRVPALVAIRRHWF